MTLVKSKPRVLIIECDPLLTDLYTSKLEEQGFDVVSSLPSTDRGFVDYVVETQPDLIQMTVLMEEVNGFDLIKLLKADRRTKKIPVFFLSNLDERKKGISLGAVDYFIPAECYPGEVAERYKEYLKNPDEYVRMTAEDERYEPIYHTHGGMGWYRIGGYIAAGITFLSIWVAAFISWGFLVGLAIGWLPAIIGAIIVRFIWPIIVIVLLILLLLVFGVFN